MFLHHIPEWWLTLLLSLNGGIYLFICLFIFSSMMHSDAEAFAYVHLLLPQMLAVKKINLVALAIYEEDEFLDVVWNMSRLRHPNIAKLLGYSVEHGEHVLVYEYASGGSLHDILFSAGNMHKALSWKARVRIALGVAHALEYEYITST